MWYGRTPFIVVPKWVSRQVRTNRIFIKKYFRFYRYYNVVYRILNPSLRQWFQLSENRVLVSSEQRWWMRRGRRNRVTLMPAFVSTWPRRVWFWKSIHVVRVEKTKYCSTCLQQSFRFYAFFRLVKYCRSFTHLSHLEILIILKLLKLLLREIWQVACQNMIG